MTAVNLRKQTWMMGAVLIALALALLMGAQFRAGAQEGSSMTQRYISVSGFGEAFGTPDLTYVSLGVDRMDADINAAVNGARDATRAIIAAVQEAGVAEADIQTANYNIYPEDRYNPTTGQPTGERVYRVSIILNITVRSLDNTANVVTAALNAGATTVNGLTFGIADSSGLETQARTNAVADARARAEELAVAFGVTLGDLISVTEGVQGGYPVPMPAARGDMMAGMGGAPQIAPGQLSVGVNVQVVFAIR
jgi:uncharacterized protein YggE